MARKDVLQRLFVRLHDGLRHVRDAILGRRINRARFRSEFAQNGRKKGGLAAAVFAQKPHAVAHVGDRRGVFIKKAGATADRDVVQAKHGVRAVS